MSLTIQCPAIAPGARIPVRHTGDGADLSPALSWSGVPGNCAQFALIVDDPDAPTPQPWVHWVIYGITGETRSLPEGVPATDRVESPVAALQGKNSWRTVGYRGPAPPPGHGVHHYHFKLYALDAALDLPPQLDKAGLLEAISDQVVAQAELVGSYER